MSEGYIEAIQKAFDAKLVAFGTANNIIIALENINAPTSTDKPYLAGYLLPTEVDSADLYFTDRRDGVYQVDVNYGQSTGSSKANAMTDKLNAAFAPGSDLSRNPVCVSILRVAPGPLIVENGWAKRPLSIYWVTHTERL